MFDESVTRKEAYFGALAGLVATTGNGTNSTGGTFAESTPTSNTPSTGTNSTVTTPTLRVPTSPASSLNLAGLIPVLLVSIIFAALL